MSCTQPTVQPKQVPSQTEASQVSANASGSSPPATSHHKHSLKKQTLFKIHQETKAQ